MSTVPVYKVNFNELAYMHTRHASTLAPSPGLEAVNTSLVSASSAFLFVFINSTMGLNVSFMPVSELLMQTVTEYLVRRRGFLQRGTLPSTQDARTAK